MSSNILKSAMAGISAIIPNVSITLIRREAATVNGITEYNETEVTAKANVQPLSPSEIRAYETYIGSYEAKKFYICGDRADIVDFFAHGNTANSFIIYSGRRYTIFSKVDYAMNGWIKVYGVQNEEAL